MSRNIGQAPKAQYDPGVFRIEALGGLQAAGGYHEPSYREILGVRREAALEAVRVLDEAIAALDENPGVEKVLNLIRRAGA